MFACCLKNFWYINFLNAFFVWKRKGNSSNVTISMFKHDDAEVDKEKTFYDFFNFRFLTHHYGNCTDFKTKLYNVTKSLTPLPSHELPFSENPPVAKEELKALQYFFLHFPCHKGSSLSQSLDPLFVIPSYMTVLIFQRPKF